MGRKKITIERIPGQSQRYVTFNKRRKGLYNKAAELCRRTGAQIAILMTSPSDNPRIFSFAHPSADAIIHAFATKSSPVVTSETKQSLASEYEKITALEEEIAREKAKQDTTGKGCWWEDVKIEDLDSKEKLEEYIDALEKMILNVHNRLNFMQAANLGNGVVGRDASNASGFNETTRTLDKGTDAIIDESGMVDDMNFFNFKTWEEENTSIMEGNEDIMQPWVLDESEFTLEDLL